MTVDLLLAFSIAHMQTWYGMHAWYGMRQVKDFMEDPLVDIHNLRARTANELLKVSTGMQADCQCRVAEPHPLNAADTAAAATTAACIWPSFALR